jgi:hypothetical protein
VVATQGCFATASGDAATSAVLRPAQLPPVPRHCPWRRTSASPLPVATQAWRLKKARNQAENQYTSIKLISYQYIKHQAHNIIYHIGQNHTGQNHISKYQNYIILDKIIYPSIKLTISYIKTSEHKIIYQIRAHDHIQTSCS